MPLPIARKTRRNTIQASSLIKYSNPELVIDIHATCCGAVAMRSFVFNAMTSVIPASCPKRPVSFIQSGRPAKPGFCAMEFYEVAVGDLTQPAITSRSTPQSNFCD